MGKRGPKRSADSRHAQFNLRLTHDELAQLRATAAEQGTSVSALIRQAVADGDGAWRPLPVPRGASPVWLVVCNRASKRLIVQVHASGEVRPRRKRTDVVAWRPLSKPDPPKRWRQEEGVAATAPPAPGKTRHRGHETAPI